jgi:hypothetical protein
MATMTVTSTYGGDALKKYILACILGGETLATQGISVQTNVKYKRKIKKLAVGNVVQCGSCDFEATSGVTITEASLEPCEMKINEDICFEDVYQLWDQPEMTAGLHNENLPQSLLDGLTEGYVKEAGQEIEKAIWQNVTDATGTTYCACFDGFECALASAVTGATSAVTVTNVVTLLNKAYALVPACVLAKPKNELVIFVSHKLLAAYEMNLATQGINTSVDAGVPTLYGIEMHAVSGMADDDNIVIGARDNFYVGTDLEADFNEIKTIDMRQTTGDEKIRFIMKFKLDVAIAYPTEVVWLH